MSKRNGFWVPLRLACWPARVLCFTLCIALLLLPSPIFGLSLNEWLSNIEQRLLNIVIYSQKLEDELENSQKISLEQQKNIEQTLRELGDLKIRLEASRSLLGKFKNRVGELLSIIAQLETRLSQLSESFENTVRPLNLALDIAEKEIRRQKIKTVIYTILAAVAAGAVGYGIGRGLSR